jgi:hypothetical protein
LHINPFALSDSSTVTKLFEFIHFYFVISEFN